MLTNNPMASSKNKFRTLLTLSLLSLASPVLAILGQTAEEAEKCYGKPVILDKKYCEASESGCHVYTYQIKASTGQARQLYFSVHAEYQNGKIWLIRYLLPEMHISDREALLTTNQGQATWSPKPFSPKNSDRLFWKDTAANSRSATFYYSKGLSVLQIVDAECSKSLSQQRHLEVLQIADLATWRPLVDIGKANIVPSQPAEQKTTP